MSKRKSVVPVPFGLGERIRTARKALGWTQPYLGKMVGVSKSAVNQWENGAVQNLKLGNLFAVAHVLGKDVRELVFGEESARGISEQIAKYPKISPQHLALLDLYDRLPKNVRHHIRALIAALASEPVHEGPG